MDKKILIDASQIKQTRVAITNSGNIDGYEFENINKAQRKHMISISFVRACLFVLRWLESDGKHVAFKFMDSFFGLIRWIHWIH